MTRVKLKMREMTHVESTHLKFLLSKMSFKCVFISFQHNEEVFHRKVQVSRIKSHIKGLLLDSELRIKPEEQLLPVKQNLFSLTFKHNVKRKFKHLMSTIVNLCQEKG